jgi:hypothetical protein
MEYSIVCDRQTLIRPTLDTAERAAANMCRRNKDTDIVIKDSSGTVVQTWRNGVKIA